jgi:hypothetical protein
MKHIHHIVPKHMGGTDDLNNLVELTVEEHAKAHRKLYEEHGDWQDKVAWQGLAGLIGHDDIMREMWNSRKGQGNHFYGRQHSKETKQKISQNRKGKGTGIRTLTEESRQLIGQAASKRNKGMIPWNAGKKLGPQSADTRRKKGKPLIYNGIEYNSINEAELTTGVSAYYIKKECTYVATSK